METEKKSKFVKQTEHFAHLKWRLKKNIRQRIASFAQLTFAEWRSAFSQISRCSSLYFDLESEALRSRCKIQSKIFEKYSLKLRIRKLRH